MLLRCTKRLAVKFAHDHYRQADFDGSRNERMLLGHGHLLILDRRPCVLFCQDFTRYVLFLPGLRAAQFSELGR
jgi:hypothetical protein